MFAQCSTYILVVARFQSRKGFLKLTTAVNRLKSTKFHVCSTNTDTEQFLAEQLERSRSIQRQDQCKRSLTLLILMPCERFIASGSASSTFKLISFAKITPDNRIILAV